MADFGASFAVSSSGIGIDVEDRDLAAFFGEPKRDAAPDALAAAGNDRYLA